MKIGVRRTKEARIKKKARQRCIFSLITFSRLTFEYPSINVIREKRTLLDVKQKKKKKK